MLYIIYLILFYTLEASLCQPTKKGGTVLFTIAHSVPTAIVSSPTESKLQAGEFSEGLHLSHLREK